MQENEFATEFVENFNMAVLDKEGRYCYVSPKWEQYTGICREEALGQQVLAVIPESKALECLHTGKPITVQTVTHHGVPAFTSYFPRFDAQHQINGVFIYVIADGLINARDLVRQMNTLSNEVEFYRSELSRERGARYSLENIIGSSSVMKAVRQKILQAARSSSTVLIEGETGTGKELIAHAVHAMSPRSAERFVRVSCAGIPAQRMEAEFFGEKGNSHDTPSRDGQPGRFALANHGSLFIDEVNLLSSTIQPKLLRVLQEQALDAPDSGSSTPIDVRLMAASALPLEQLVQAGQFRADLFYRLDVIRIVAPPLREHLEDLPELTEELVARLNRQLGLSVEGVTEEVIHMFQDYSWPGNIRELQNVLETAMNSASGPILQVADFYRLAQAISAQRYQHAQPHKDFSLRSAKQTFEAGIIRDALAYTKGNRASAARLLGISRTVLYQKMQQHNLK